MVAVTGRSHLVVSTARNRKGAHLGPGACGPCEGWMPGRIRSQIPLRWRRLLSKSSLHCVLTETQRIENQGPRWYMWPHGLVVSPGCAIGNLARFEGFLGQFSLCKMVPFTITSWGLRSPPVLEARVVCAIITVVVVIAATTLLLCRSQPNDTSTGWAFWPFSIPLFDFLRGTCYF
jgi:hypothetical protein